MLHNIVSSRRFRVILFVVFSGLIGGYLVFRSIAATPIASIEAENGQTTENLQIQNASESSNGKHITFQNSKKYYVSTTGSDIANNGSEVSPWRTVKKGLETVKAGETLIIRGGTYAEQIKNPVITAGTATAPITVKAYLGERPIIQGLLWMKNMHYWTFDGINVTWGASNTSSDHMVKMIEGNYWHYTNSELWGAHSYSALLISKGTGWKVDYNYLHDTYTTNALNQDHLIYISEGLSGGVIERNTFRTSPNGRGIKVGQPDGIGIAPGNLDIRYNTFYDNLGPSNIQVSYGATDVRMTRNIFVKSLSGRANITTFSLTGTGNYAKDNIGWESTKIVETGNLGLVDGGGNQFFDPQLVDPNSGDFHSNNPTAVNYGRYAP